MDQSQTDKKVASFLPLVSVITPVLNCRRWISNCINSVIDQDYPNIEHIVVDGGSTDGTLEICNEHTHLIIHSEKDRGQSHAINKGFSMASGDILCWLCADDEFEPESIGHAVKGIMSGNSVVTGKSTFIDENGEIISEHPANKFPGYNHKMFIKFWRFNPISQPGTFWSRKIWEVCAPAREDLYFAMDYDLWLRMSHYTPFRQIDAYIGKYRIHPEAKCFADNYGSRIELIKVSRQYWPSKLNLEYWRLYFSYLTTANPITQHYADGEKLLQAVTDQRKNSKLGALKAFLLAHLKHLATPLLPKYPEISRALLSQLTGFHSTKRTFKKHGKDSNIEDDKYR